MISRRLATVAAAGALAVTLVPGTATAEPTSQPDSRPTTAAAAPDGSPDAARGLLPARYTHQSLSWQSCGDIAPGLECARVQVPLDYRHPRSRSIEVAISRLPAANPALRRGVMLVNPGGPGGSGLGLPLYIAQLLQVRPDILDRYDLIGFDPRFVGHSTPATCDLTPDEMEVTRWPGPGGFDAEVATARTVAAKCARNAGWALPHATTLNTARDLDVVRSALGEDRISYLGYSYGTDLGRAYLSLFPRRADRFVLDSNSSPLRVGREADRLFSPNFERMLNLFTAFAAKDPARYGLGTTSAAARQAFDALIAQAGTTPIQSGAEVFTANDIRQITFRLLYAENRFDLLGQFVATLRAGQPLPDSIAFLANLRKFTAEPGVPMDNFVAGFYLISCGDNAYPRDVEQYRREFTEDSVRYPFAGPATSSISPCAFWPELDREPAPQIAGNPAGLLLVNSTGDPATPYEGAVATRVLMPNSRLVTVVASHHAVLGEFPSTCVEGAVADYFVTGRKHDLLCGPSTQATRRSPATRAADASLALLPR